MKNSSIILKVKGFQNLNVFNSVDLNLYIYVSVGKTVETEHIQHINST